MRLKFRVEDGGYELHRKVHCFCFCFWVRMMQVVSIVNNPANFHLRRGHCVNIKVPYDYDSEFQDKYMRIATAVIQENISIHRALTYQTEIQEGKHTARSGLFLRTHPGRLLLYPLVAATCTIIFFGGEG